MRLRATSIVKVAPLPIATRTTCLNFARSGRVPYGPSQDAISRAPGLLDARENKSLVNPSCEVMTTSRGLVDRIVKG
jgi:hypothetical protein